MSNFIFKIYSQIWQNQPNLCHLLKEDKNYIHDKQYKFGKDDWYD